MAFSLTPSSASLHVASQLACAVFLISSAHTETLVGHLPLPLPPSRPPALASAPSKRPSGPTWAHSRDSAPEPFSWGGGVFPVGWAGPHSFFSSFEDPGEAFLPSLWILGSALPASQSLPAPKCSAGCPGCWPFGKPPSPSDLRSSLLYRDGPGIPWIIPAHARFGRSPLLRKTPPLSKTIPLKTQTTDSRGEGGIPVGKSVPR